jgi:hypothetical protein
MFFDIPDGVQHAAVIARANYILNFQRFYLTPLFMLMAFRHLLTSGLRLFRCLHSRRNSYPVVTTSTGMGLSPAGLTRLFTVHLD